jgi:hypothetical protein
MVVPMQSLQNMRDQLEQVLVGVDQILRQQKQKEAAEADREVTVAQKSDQERFVVDEDQVETIDEFSKSVGLHPVTVRRLIKRGEGPTITWMSARRMGVRVRHKREWLDSRTRAPEENAS